MIQIRKEDNQKKQKEKKLKIYKVNTHKKTVIALWVLLAVSFLFAVYKNFTAIDIHTVHETKVIEETILDTHKIENFVENFAEVYYSWEQSAASIDNRTNALKGYLTGELQALNVDTVRKDIPVSSALTDFQIWEIAEEKEQHYQVTYTVEQRITDVVVKHFCNTLFENSPGISSFKWCFPIIVGMRTDMIVPYVHISV